MTENIELGLQLLLVGMLSVFFILSIVIGLARLLIYLVNRYAPASPGSDSASPKAQNLKHIAVLAATVDLITKGRGEIQSIKKT